MIDHTSQTGSPSYLELVAEVKDWLAPSLAEDWPRLPATRAEGAYLYTADGRRYLDFTSGIAVTNLGHNHPRVLEAAIRQMRQFSHSAVGVTLHEPLLRLCQALSKVTPDGMDMFFFGNSGAEAVDGALKLARYVTGRPAFIGFKGSFHGRTFGAMSLTAVKSKYRSHYEPLLPGVYFAEYAYPYRCPFGNDPKTVTRWSLDSLQDLFDHQVSPTDVAAILVEPIQGEGGYVVPPPGFLQGLRKICDQYGILLIFDEIQSGFGRTGQMFAAQTFGVRPDIMAVAKGIANGFPLSATIAPRALMSQWKAGAHGTTFGGNPVACAAGVETLAVIKEENLLENCRKMGARLLDGLKSLQSRFACIGDVRGVGLMVAVEMIVPGKEKTPNGAVVMKVLENCLERGLLGYMAGTWGQVVRMIPPLIVTPDQIDESLNIIEASIPKSS